MSEKTDPKLHEKIKAQLDELEARFEDFSRQETPPKTEKDSGTYLHKRVKHLEEAFRDLETRSESSFTRVATAIRVKISEMQTEVHSLQKQTEGVNLKSLIQKMQTLERTTSAPPSLAHTADMRVQLDRLDKRFQELQARVPGPSQDGQGDLDGKKLKEIEAKIALMQEEMVFGAEKMTATVVKRVKVLDEKLKSLERASNNVAEERLDKLEGQQRNLSKAVAAVNAESKVTVEHTARLLDEKLKGFEEQVVYLRDQSEKMSEPIFNRLAKEIGKIDYDLRTLDQKTAQVLSQQKNSKMHTANLENEMNRLDSRAQEMEKDLREHFKERLKHLELAAKEWREKEGTLTEEWIAKNQKEHQERSLELKALKKEKDAQFLNSQLQVEGLLAGLEEKLEGFQSQASKRTETLSREMKTKLGALRDEMANAEKQMTEVKQKLQREFLRQMGPLEEYLGIQGKELRQALEDMNDQQQENISKANEKFVSLESKTARLEKEVGRGKAADTQARMDQFSEEFGDHVMLIHHQLENLETKAVRLESDFKASLDVSFQKYDQQQKRARERSRKEHESQIQSVEEKAKTLEQKFLREVREVKAKGHSRQEDLEGQFKHLKENVSGLEENALESKITLAKHIDSYAQKFNGHLNGVDQRISKVKKSLGEMIHQHREDFGKSMEDFERNLSSRFQEMKAMEHSSLQFKESFEKWMQQVSETEGSLKKSFSSKVESLSDKVYQNAARMLSMGGQFREFTTKHQEDLKGIFLQMEERLQQKDRSLDELSAKTDGLRQDVQNWLQENQASDQKAFEALEVKLEDFEKEMQQVQQRSASFEKVMNALTEERLEGFQRKLEDLHDQFLGKENLFQDALRKEEAVRAELASFMQAAYQSESERAQKLEMALTEFQTHMEVVDTQTLDLKQYVEELVKDQRDRLREEVSLLKEQIVAEDQILLKTLERTESVETEVKNLSQRANQSERDLKAKFQEDIETLEQAISDLGHQTKEDSRQQSDLTETKLLEMKRRFEGLEAQTLEVREEIEAALSGQLLQLETQFERFQGHIQSRKEKLAEQFEERDHRLRTEREQILDGVRNKMTFLETHLGEMGHRIADEIETKFDLFKKALADLEVKSSESHTASEKALGERFGKLEARIHSVQVVTRGAAEQIAEDLGFEIEALQQEFSKAREEQSGLEEKLLKILKEKTDSVKSEVANLEKHHLNLNRKITADFDQELLNIGSRIADLDQKSQSLDREFEEKLNDRLNHLALAVSREQTMAAASQASRLDDVEKMIARLEGEQSRSDQNFKSMEGRVRDQLKTSLLDAEMQQHETLIEITDKLLARMEGFEGKILKLNGEMGKASLEIDERLSVQVKGVQTGLTELKEQTDQRISHLSSSFEDETEWVRARLKEMEIRTEMTERTLEHKLELYFNDMELKFKQHGYHTEKQVGDLRLDLDAFGARLRGLTTDLREFDDKTTSSLQELHEKMHLKTERLHLRINELNEHQTQVHRNVLEHVTQVTQTSEKQASERLSRVGDRMLEYLMKRSTISLGILFLIAAMTFAMIYVWLSSQMTQEVATEVEEQFQSEQVQETVEKAALKQIPELVENEAVPLVANLKDQLSKQSEEFDTFVTSTKIEYQKAYLSVLNELSVLQQHNRITQLEGAAINQGDRLAYDALREISKDRSNEEARFAAQAALGRLEAFYQKTDRIAETRLTYKGPTGFTYRGAHIPPEALVYYLRKGKSWKTRAKAARLLGTWDVVGLPDVLLDAAEKDPHLEVITNALQSFERVTGFKNAGIFDVQTAREWLEVHRKAVNEKVRRP